MMISMKRINLIGSALKVQALLGLSTRGLSLRNFGLALLAMVLVGMAFWSTPADAGEPAEPVWSADMTVVEYSSVSMGAASADLFSNVGGSGNLQIKSLWSHIPGRDLRLAFQEGVPNASDYTLQVGGLSLEFPEGSSGDSNFKWNDVDVDWEDGQLIRVRIVLTADSEVQQTNNTPASGVPTIIGTAQVGETLSADTSGIADEDGLDSVSYNYQWIRIDANIADATDSTYTLTDHDQGKTIKLEVSFIDDKGNSETLTIVAAAEVSNRPQFLVSNLGVGVEGAGGIQRTLSAARSGFAQAFTTGASTNGYAVGAVDIQMSNFFDASNVGDQLRVTINGVASGGGPGDAHCTLTNPSTFTDLSVITFEAPTGADSCQQLAAETTYFVVIEWISPSGTDSFAVIPQTYPTKKSAATAEDAGGAEGWSIADESYYLAVSSDARTWTAYDETASFKIQVKEGAVTAAKANSPATGAPTISGTPQVGQTLTAGTSDIADTDELTKVSYSYQWIANDGTEDADIEDATDSTYIPSVSDVGKTIKVKVSFTDDADNDETLTSAATEAVAAKPNSEPTGLPAITGTPQVGVTLTADTSAISDEDGLDDVSFSYQWIVNDGNSDADIEDATDSTYIPSVSDVGKTIKVKVSFTDDADNDETLTSAATEAVAAKPNSEPTGLPAITGTPQVGVTLTADTSAISDEDGLDDVSFSYQWIVNDRNSDANIEDATDSTYTLALADLGKTIKVQVTFTDDDDNAETLTSVATEAVAAVPTEPLNLTVTSGSQIQELDASWQVPSSNGGSAVTGYKVQWKDAADSWDTEADVSQATVTGTTHTITGLTDGVEYTVRVMAVNDVGEGSPSAEASGTPQQAAIWSATLTVGVAETFAGYTTFLPDSTVLGALSSDTITLDDASYTVKALGVLNGKLIFSVIPKLTAGFVLVVGTDEFASTDASTLEGTSIIQFQWNDPGLDLPEGEEVAVRMTPPDENTPATGAPTITGTPQVGETLTVDTSAIADEDGLGDVSYSYQWIANDGTADTEIDDATESTYTPSVSDVGKTIKVEVSFTDDADNQESPTSLATEAVAATVPTAPQSLTVTSGSQIQELDVTWQAPSSNGGSAVTGYKVQWKESADSWDTEADVTQATETGTTHTITGLTGGVEYAVRVIATNDVGDGPASSEAAGTPAGGVSEQTTETENSAPTGLPSIGGTPQVDQTLTADTSAIDDADGLTNVSYRYQWISDGTDIEGATSSTYTLVFADQGKTIKVKVSFTDDADNAESLTSVPTVAVAAAPNREATGAPTISGTPQVDETLTANTSAIADEDGLTNVSYSYQWIADGTDIDGATGSSYALTSSEQGQTIQVRVSFTDDRDNAESLTSVATETVAQAPSPLTVSLENAAASHNGTDVFTFEIRFSEQFGLSYKTLRDDAFTVVGGNVKKAQRMDRDSDTPNTWWLITVEPDGNGDVTVTLPATTDCTDDGAICTEDGRMLSNSLELTVSGPGQ